MKFEISAHKREANGTGASRRLRGRGGVVIGEGDLIDDSARFNHCGCGAHVAD